MISLIHFEGFLSYSRTDIACCAVVRILTEIASTLLIGNIRARGM